MQSNPHFSIIIPTYNHAQFLRRALQSVIDQTYPKWEALVIDNHSEDNTVDVVKELHDSRIRILKIKNNGVIAASRNLGIREAKGEWIAFLDSDDYWYRDKLNIVMEETKVKNLFDVISTDEIMVNIRNNSSKVLKHGPTDNHFYKTLLVHGNRLSPSATVLRKNFIINNRIVFNESQNYITVEDYDFWLNIARIGGRFKFIRQVQGEYVIHGNNNSSNYLIHSNNTKLLLMDHVYKIQKFTTQHEQLWSLIEPRLRIMKIKNYFLTKKFKYCLLEIIILFLKYPRPTIKHTITKFITRF